MKRFRPHCAGYIVLYVLTLISFADVVYTIYRQSQGLTNDYYASFSFFSYIILAMALCYSWMYVRAQVCFDGDKLRVAFPANIKPRQGEGRAMIIYRQGEFDLKFIDKTFNLKLLTSYGYVEDLGYEPLDRSPGGEKSKLFPVHEVAFITSENKRYHMNAGIYNDKQKKEIFTMVRDISGIEPEGKLAEILK